MALADEKQSRIQSAQIYRLRILQLYCQTSAKFRALDTCYTFAQSRFANLSKPSQFRPCTSELPPKETNSSFRVLSAPAGVNSKSCGAGIAGCTINSDGMLRLFVALFHILLHISFWRYCCSEKLKNKQTIKLNCFRSKCFYLQLSHEATHRVYCRNMPCILNKDLTRFMPSLSRVCKNQVSERKALLAG